jgi:Flp pilus assembly protein TadG
MSFLRGTAARLRAGSHDTAGRDDADRGAATLFVIGLSTMLLVLSGLVVDGGMAINARAQAADVAEQAARAGAQEIDENVLRNSGNVVLDADAASDAAEGFLNESGFSAKPNADGTVTVNGDEVTVAVSRNYNTIMLGLIGIGEFTVSADATARPAVGIEDEL